MKEEEKTEYINFWNDNKDWLEENTILDISKVDNKTKDNLKTEVNNVPKQFDNIKSTQNRNMNIEEEDNKINDNVPQIEKNDDKNEKVIINIVIPILEDTRELTNIKKKKINREYLRETTKGKKEPYGKWIIYYITNPKKKMPRINNKFIKKHEIGNDILTYFSDDSPKFLTHRAIDLKEAIVDYGQKIINESIKVEGKFLYYISYDDFCKKTEKNFTKPNYGKKLEALFIEYQDNKNIKFKDNNKNVIKYIRENKKYEQEANMLLDLTFYQLCEVFSEYYLENYLEKKRNELISSYESETGKTPSNELIQAYSNIIEILCENFKEYSTSEKQRKVKKKKNLFSIKMPPKKKRKKGKKKGKKKK